MEDMEHYVAKAAVDDTAATNGVAELARMEHYVVAGVATIAADDGVTKTAPDVTAAAIDILCPETNYTSEAGS